MAGIGPTASSQLSVCRFFLLLRGGDSVWPVGASIFRQPRSGCMSVAGYGVWIPSSVDGTDAGVAARGNVPGEGIG